MWLWITVGQQGRSHHQAHLLRQPNLFHQLPSPSRTKKNRRKTHSLRYHTPKGIPTRKIQSWCITYILHLSRQKLRIAIGPSSLGTPTLEWICPTNKRSISYKYISSQKPPPISTPWRTSSPQWRKMINSKQKKINHFTSTNTKKVRSRFFRLTNSTLELKLTTRPKS